MTSSPPAVSPSTGLESLSPRLQSLVQGTRVLLERCIADGAIESPDDMELTLDLVFGPLFYRLLMGHAPITRDFVDRLLDAVIRARR